MQRIESELLKTPQDPLNDIKQNLHIGNNYIDQVKQSIESYRQVLEELMKMKVQTPRVFPLFELLRDIVKWQFK